jgi:hypothetical protein
MAAAAAFCGKRKHSDYSAIPCLFYTEVDLPDEYGGGGGGDAATAEVWRMNRKLRMEKNRAKKEKAQKKGIEKLLALVKEGEENYNSTVTEEKNEKKKEMKGKKKKKQKKEEEEDEGKMCEEERYYRDLKPPCKWCGEREAVKFRYFNNRYRTEGSRASSFDQPRFCCRSTTCNGLGKEFSPGPSILHYRDFLLQLQQLAACCTSDSTSDAYDVTLEELVETIEADLEELPTTTGTSCGTDSSLMYCNSTTFTACNYSILI